MPPTLKAVLETERRHPREERRLHFYAKGETIPVLAQGVWQVGQGLVQLSTLYPTGEEGLLGWVGPSMCFSLWLSCLETYQAKALSDVYLMWFSVAEVESSPRLAQEMLPQLARRLRQVEAMLAIAGQRRVEDRLHQLLLLLKQEMGQPVSQGTRLLVRLTHQDIASAIGTSRVTVTRMLGKLRKEGAIDLDAKRHLIIRDTPLSHLRNGSVLRHGF
jgi:CRP-like cAMP-binding protein